MALYSHGVSLVLVMVSCCVALAASPKDALKTAMAAAVPKSQAHRCDDFVNSVGVCMHLGRVRTHYVERFAEIERLLLASGIRHVRTDPVTAPEAFANVKRLAAAGVKFDFIIHPDGDSLHATRCCLNTGSSDLPEIGAGIVPTAISMIVGKRSTIETSSFSRRPSSA